MPGDGSHLICKKHLEETYYCSIQKEWVCLTCEFENNHKS